MRILIVVALAAVWASACPAQTDQQRAVLAMAATIYTAALTCPGGLDPDPTETVAMLVSASGIEPSDVAVGGRYYDLFRSMIVGLAEEMKGKTPDEACMSLKTRYPTWIRP